MRWTHLLFAGLLFPLVSLAWVLEPVTLEIPPSVRTVLDVVADGMTTEIPVCLRGVVHDHRKTFLVTKYEIPTILYSDTISNFYTGCKGVMGLWHNHPKNLPVPAGEDRTWLCALSAEDLATAQAQRYPLMVVQVDKDIRCWWTREQLKDIPHSTYTASIPGQRTF